MTRPRSSPAFPSGAEATRPETPASTPAAVRADGGRHAATALPMASVVRAAGALLLALALAACGESGEAGAAWAGSVRDSAGVTIIENPDQGTWGAGEGWTLQEEVRIGVADGDPELQFGSITGLDVDAQGRIWVLDNQASRIRVFGPGGDLVDAFGRRGQGPGELSAQAMGLFTADDGSVLVADLGNQRILRLGADGEPLETRPVDLSTGIPMLYQAGGDGRVYQQVRLMSLPGMAEIVGGPRDLVLALDAGGAVADTVAELPSGQTFEFNEGGVPTIRIFSPENVWAVTGEGRVVTGLNSVYSLEIRAPGQGPSTILRRASSRRPVSDGEQRAMREGMRRAWAEAGMPEAVAAQMEQAVQFEPNWPALAALLPGPEGTLWVQQVDPDASLDASAFEDLQNLQFGSPRWDVFDREGRYLGVVEMPEGFAPRRVVEGAVYGVLQDDLGIQRVVRYRVVGGGN